MFQVPVKVSLYLGPLHFKIKPKVPDILNADQPVSVSGQNSRQMLYSFIGLK